MCVDIILRIECKLWNKDVFFDTLVETLQHLNTIVCNGNTRTYILNSPSLSLSVQGCDKSFTTKEKLNRHTDTHKNTKQFSCPHKNCNRVFLRQSHLKNHLKIHTQDHQFVCPVLGKGRHVCTCQIRLCDLTLSLFLSRILSVSPLLSLLLLQTAVRSLVQKESTMFISTPISTTATSVLIQTATSVFPPERD